MSELIWVKNGISSALVLSADGRIHTPNRSCTTRTAAGTTSIRRAARLRWALTVWPTTGTGTALWPWDCQEARSSAAQERIWLEETPWTAPPLTAQLKPLEPPPPRWAPITDAHDWVFKNMLYLLSYVSLVHKNSSPNTNDLYIHYMDKSTGTPSLEEKRHFQTVTTKIT